MDTVAGFIQRFVSELSHILLESGVWLIAGLAIAGLIHAFVPSHWFMRHLGGRGAWPVVKASLLGIPMPLCSCSVIPVAAGLRRQGAGKGASAAFAISTPQTGEESIPITWALFGPVFALARPVIAVITAMIAGLAINAADRTDAPPIPPMPPNTPDTPGSPDGSCGQGGQGGPAPSLGARFRSVWSHGFGTMLQDLAPWLAVGILMAAVIAAAVPPGWITEHVGTGLWPKIAMLFVGLPLYICATSSTPLAWSLVMAGLSPGAAIVLLLSGPATNIATISWVIKDLGVRALVIYLVAIGAVSLGAGVVFDAYFAHTLVLASRAAEDAVPATAWGWIQIGGAVVFVMLLVNAVVTRYWPGGKGSTACCTPPANDVPPPMSSTCCAGPGPACTCQEKP